jgi:hypothetical protein
MIYIYEWAFAAFVSQAACRGTKKDWLSGPRLSFVMAHVAMAGASAGHKTPPVKGANQFFSGVCIQWGPEPAT